MNANRFDAYSASMAVGTGAAEDEFDYLDPFHDEALNDLGRQQQEITDTLPTAAQTHSAIFQAGCLMHCGMGSNLYDEVYTTDGTVMRDALATCVIYPQPVQYTGPVARVFLLFSGTLC